MGEDIRVLPAILGGDVDVNGDVDVDGGVLLGRDLINRGCEEWSRLKSIDH